MRAHFSRSSPLFRFLRAESGLICRNEENITYIPRWRFLVFCSIFRHFSRKKEGRCPLSVPSNPPRKVYLGSSPFTSNADVDRGTKSRQKYEVRTPYNVQCTICNIQRLYSVDVETFQSMIGAVRLTFMADPAKVYFALIYPRL
jgi:hypothetical protein